MRGVRSLSTLGVSLQDQLRKVGVEVDERRRERAATGELLSEPVVSKGPILRVYYIPLTATMRAHSKWRTTDAALTSSPSAVSKTMFWPSE